MQHPMPRYIRLLLDQDTNNLAIRYRYRHRFIADSGLATCFCRIVLIIA